MTTAAPKKKSTPTKSGATTKKVVAPAPRPSRARSWSAGIVLVIATLLLPTAIVGNWASVQISNSNAFVNEIAPLAKNPAVQKVITDAVSTQISKAINVDKLTTELAGGVATALKLPPALQKIVTDLSGPMANGVDALIRDTVNKFVTSDAFSAAFEKSITFTHEQLVALLSGNENSALQLDNDGTLSLPLGPLVENIKQQLVAQHVPFAKLIPTINASITIGKIPDLVAARIAYQVGVGIGTWLPWAVFGLFVLSIALARKHWRQIFVSGVVTFVMAGLVGIGLSFGRIILVSSLAPSLSAASSAIYDSIVQFVAQSVAGLLVLSVVAMLIGAVMGFTSTAHVRSWFGRGFARGRDGVQSLGISTGNFGSWLHSNRVAVRVGIIAVAVLIGFVCGPLNPVVIVAVTLLGSGLLVANEVLAQAK